MNMCKIGNNYPNLDNGMLLRGRWTDKSFALNQGRLGVLQKPDYDFTNRGLLFPQNDPSEYIQVLDQMDHAKQLGTPIHLHVHFIQATALIPVFKTAYKFWNNGDPVPAADTIISTADSTGPVFPFTGTPILQILPFLTIQPPANEGLSAHLEFNLYRDDNVVVGDVLAKYVDYHYIKDSDGSRFEFTK